LPQLQIATVGFDLPSDQISNLNFYSDSSLLDFDLILFSPNIDAETYASSSYLGKPSFDDDHSFRLKDALRHWKRELSEALEHGKTIFVYLCAHESVYAATGDKEHSGTGKNRQTINIVDLVSNYSCLPLDIKPIAASGTKMSLYPEFKELLQQYWAFAEGYSSYRVIPDLSLGRVCIKTHTGEKAVGRTLSHTKSDGLIFLLPFIDLDRDYFLDETEYGQMIWNDAGMQVGAQLIKQLIWVHNNARQHSTKTPAPDWATHDTYLLRKETELIEVTTEINRKIDKLVDERDTTEEELREQSKLRDLLFENGPALEEALHLALGQLGFVTSRYNENGSEFDVVFESPEGRLLGEAEGKDSKAVNVGKLRQLQMNVLEDFEREDVEQLAKGVLFGNGFRLTEPCERPEQFTAKCVAAATQNGTALVSTFEVFTASKYLAENEDEAFSKTCREAILHGKGIVLLPKPPECQIE
jgi:hypothetical protein